MIATDTDTELFESHLSAAQLELYRTCGHVFVVAQDGQVYLIHDGGSIVVMYAGRQQQHVCAFALRKHVEPGGSPIVSREVSMLTQLLFLRSKSRDNLIAIACGEGFFVAEPVLGCPPMVGRYAAAGVPRGV